MSRGGIFSAIAGGLPEHRRRIESRRLAGLERDYGRWLARHDDAHRASAEGSLPGLFLIGQIAEALEQIVRHRQTHAQFLRQISRNPELSAGTDLHLLNYARSLGARGKRLRGDEKALARDFGADALNERVQ